MIPADSLRAALDSAFRGGAYDWVRPPRGQQLLERWWDAVAGWLDRMRGLHPGLAKLIVIAVAIALAGLLIHGIVVAVLTARRAAAIEGSRAALPSRSRGAEEWLREADELAARGRFAEAMQAAFLGLALRLDRRGIVKFHPSKTPGDYAREAQLAGAERVRFMALVRALYSVAFGGAACTLDDYRRWRAAGESHATP